MKEKLLELAELAGFDTNKGFVTVVGKQYSSIGNPDITDKLTRFYELVQAEMREQLKASIEALNTKLFLATDALYDIIEIDNSPDFICEKKAIKVLKEIKSVERK